MTFKTELYPWQRAAADKLLRIRVGALYMEMGTGKTRTALEMIDRRMKAGKIGKALWLCPCSVRQNLKDDIVKHSGSALSHIAIYGIESLSSSVRLYEALVKFVSSGNVMLIVDESNLVKNFAAVRTRRVIDLASRCRYRLILNGTPISRNEADLFAQWYILDWRILGYQSFWSFAANHLEYDPEIPGKIRRTLNTDYLVEKIAPYSYQVSRSDCFSLPGKNYVQVRTWMEPGQAGHYDDIVNMMIEKLDERRPETIYRMFAAAQAIISGLYVTDSGGHFKTSPMFLSPTDNPRIRTLLDIVNDEPIDQAIIFCRYAHEIEAILQVLPDSVPFYGKQSHRERQKSLDAFKGGARFLVANRTCAGYGLNLQFCHTVIYYSNDWDWATRIQSEDRVYRLGQESPVTIYDIFAADSLDVKIQRCLARKERLEDAIKRELKDANSIQKARGKYRSWLHGKMEEADGKGVS